MGNNRQKLSKPIWVLAVVLAAIVSAKCAVAQGNQAQDGKQLSPTSQFQRATTNNRLIVVSIPDRKLVFVEDGAVKRVYPVAVGKPSTPSPAGQFTIVRRVSDPAYSQ